MLRVEGEGEEGGLRVLGELPKKEANGIGSRGVDLVVVAPGRGGNGGFGAGAGLGGSESDDVYSPSVKVGYPDVAGGNGGSCRVALGTVDLNTRASLEILRTQTNNQVTVNITRPRYPRVRRASPFASLQTARRGPSRLPPSAFRWSLAQTGARA